jgi:hypothetical protein
MKAILTKLVFALWAALAVRAQKAPDAKEIADAAVDSVLTDYEAGLPPIGRDYVQDLAVQSYWAFRESSLSKRALGDGGKSRGPWQLQGACGHRSVAEQAKCWRLLARDGVRSCPRAPYAILYGGCRIPLSKIHVSWTTESASLQRVAQADRLLGIALGVDHAQDAPVDPVYVFFPSAEQGIEAGALGQSSIRTLDDEQELVAGPR